MEDLDHCFTHSNHPPSLEHIVQQATQEIQNNENLNANEKKQNLKYLTELSECSIGQFLLLNKGLNGFWTDYILQHPNQGKISRLNLEGKPLSSMERFLLEEAPIVLATQQRAKIFAAQTQMAVKNHANLACIPSGLMGEFLYLNYENIDAIRLVAIDVDSLSLQLAKQSAKQKNLYSFCQFSQQDALNLKFFETFDLISSNGLNMYINDDNLVTKLYQRFFDALKPGGKLVTSTLTPPPVSRYDCEWDFTKINANALIKQAIIFGDIIGATWQTYRSSKDTQSQLASVGFKHVECIFDDARMMPTLIAYK